MFLNSRIAASYVFRALDSLMFPFTDPVSQVIFADRMEDIECDGGLIECPDAVDDPAGDAPDCRRGRAVE